ncbi:MbeD/MobD family mobilization/exclusion protein, partial [Enterobacter intestinihominis]
LEQLQHYYLERMEDWQSEFSEWRTKRAPVSYTNLPLPKTQHLFT